MPRVPCNDCGIDVVVDPTGRCPEGHVVVEDAPRARSRTTRPPARQTPWAADPDAPPRATDLLREIHSLHAEEAGTPDPAPSSRPAPSTAPPGPTADQDTTELDLQLTELEAVMDATAPTHSPQANPPDPDPPGANPSEANPPDAGVPEANPPGGVNTGAAASHPADDELDAWDEEWVAPRAPAGTDHSTEASTPPPPIPPPGAPGAFDAADDVSTQAPLWGPRAGRHGQPDEQGHPTDPPVAPDDAPMSRDEHAPDASDITATDPPHSGSSESGGSDHTAPPAQKPPAAPVADSEVTHKDHASDGAAGPPVDALQGFTARGKPVGGRRRRRRD